MRHRVLLALNFGVPLTSCFMFCFLTEKFTDNPDYQAPLIVNILSFVAPLASVILEIISAFILLQAVQKIKKFY
jgi:hypothetical protein